jgi:hypothetical protein
VSRFYLDVLDGDQVIQDLEGIAHNFEAKFLMLTY